MSETLNFDLFSHQTLAGFVKASGDVKTAIDINAAFWLDILKMARNLASMIPIPSLYLTAGIAVLDWIIRYLESTATTLAALVS